MVAAAPLITALSIGAGAASTVAGVVGADRNNRAIARSKRTARERAVRQQQELANAAGLERQKNINSAQQSAGRIRVAAGAAGTAGGGTFLALQQQAAQDTALNNAIVNRNLAVESNRLIQGLEVDFARLESAVQNPLLIGLGGLVQTGLRIASASATSDIDSPIASTGFGAPRQIADFPANTGFA